MSGIDRPTDHDPTMAIATLAPEAREDRDARAARYLTRTGNADLLEMLGLAETARLGASPTGVACPTCSAVEGAACNKQYTEGTTNRYHRSRYRLVGVERS